MAASTTFTMQQQETSLRLQQRLEEVTCQLQASQAENNALKEQVLVFIHSFIHNRLIVATWNSSICLAPQ